jgi:hypothetical protein
MGIGDWFRGQKSSPPVQDTDFRAIDSRPKAEALHRAGSLGKLLLMPREFGGSDQPVNTLYVPPAIAQRKSAIDLEVILPLAQQGKITHYTATPEYHGKSVVPAALTITVSDPVTYRFTINIWGPALERESTSWDQTYAAREAAYQQHFGSISGDVQKLMNLTGVWPGGCLVQIECPQHQLWVTSSFGLTNPDMPARTRTEQFAAGKTPQGTTEYRMRVLGRPPRPVPLGLAGYGYEMLLFTRRQERWPLMFLNWSVQAEILTDVDLLGRVHDCGAITVESISLGDGRRADFLVAPLQQLAPPKIDLPNGSMELLAATLITRAEMEFGVKQGGPALLARINARPQGQISTMPADKI